MKKIIAIMLAALMVAVLFTACNSSKPASETPAASETEGSEAVAGEKGTLVLGLDDSFPPMGYRDENNEIVGFDIDLAKEVAARMGYELVLQPIDWDSKELELETGNIDVLWNGMTITEERKESMEVSKPYLENAQVVVVNSGSDITAISDLAGKNVGLQKGSSAAEALEDNEIYSQVGEVFEYENNVLALADLAVGRLDAVVVDVIVANYYITSEGSDFVILDEALAPEEYGIAAKKGNTELIEGIEKALEEMIIDGTAEEICQKWFGKMVLLGAPQ